MDDVIRLDKPEQVCAVALVRATLAKSNAVHCHVGDQIKWLIEHGYGVNKPNAKGETPLVAAAGYGFVDVIALLLDEGADINASNPNRRTPLMKAASLGHVEAVSYLIERGCNLFLQDKRGLNALDWARKVRQGEVVTLLEAAVERRIAGERAAIAQRKEEEALNRLADTNQGLANGLSKALSDGTSLETVRVGAGAAAVPEPHLTQWPASRAAVRDCEGGFCHPCTVPEGDGLCKAPARDSFLAGRRDQLRVDGAHQGCGWRRRVAV